MNKKRRNPFKMLRSHSTRYLIFRSAHNCTYLSASQFDPAKLIVLDLQIKRYSAKRHRGRSHQVLYKIQSSILSSSHSINAMCKWGGRFPIYFDDGEKNIHTYEKFMENMK